MVAGDRDRLLDLGCGRVGGVAGLVGVDDAGAGRGEGHRAAGHGAHPRAAGGVDGEHDRDCRSRRRWPTGSPSRPRSEAGAVKVIDWGLKVTVIVCWTWGAAA